MSQDILLQSINNDYYSEIIVALRILFIKQNKQSQRPA